MFGSLFEILSTVRMATLCLDHPTNSRQIQNIIISSVPQQVSVLQHQFLGVVAIAPGHVSVLMP
jgi:hypothetical protein